MPSDSECASDAESKEGSKQPKKPVSPSKELTTKRRTKTGCLTCRKRRIKCGEERPTCKNCIKSKRECAGYNQPLVYKPHAQSQAQPESIQPSPAVYGWPVTQHDGAQAPLHSSYPSALLDHSLQPVSGEWQQSGLPEWMSSSSITQPQLDDCLPARSVDNLSGQRLSESSYQSVHNLPTAASDMGHSTGPLINTRQGEGMAKTIYLTQADNDDCDDRWDVDFDGQNMNMDVDHAQNVSQGPSLVRPVRSQSDFMSDGSQKFQLASLAPSFPSMSPLLNEKSQRILQHFISVTGPCMGISNRYYYVNDSDSPRTIWTHGLPAMAFRYPALAHAILAISAVHMSKLGLGNENTAVKHFTLALKRIGKVLGEPKQRLQVSTLATILLLGYYEAMTGDHSKWNLHLSGAGRLVMEHDYAGMVRTLRCLQESAKINVAQPWIKEQVTSMKHSLQLPSNGSLDLFESRDWKVDHNLIARLIGSEVNYNTQVQPNLAPKPAILNPDKKTLDDWMILVELYWWYCKQDIFMSMLSGDPLLLPYAQWKFCPPRGQLNNIDKPHATFDHLWLLLARLTDFGGRDRKRKQQVINSQGGHWIPPPGFLGTVRPPQDSGRPNSEGRGDLARSMDGSNRSAPPSANEGRARKARQTPAQQPPSQPPFYGMMPPTTGPIQMPSSFKVMNAELQSRDGIHSTDAEPVQNQDLAAQTKHALEEHACIAEAFDLFESSLDSNYHPLASNDIQIATPSGPAIQYRSPIIATMWTYFYVGRILLHRLHPHSPPAAMVSAGINARKTHEYAQLVGRICGGLFARHSYLLQAGHVDHNLSAAAIEMTLSLLFAAVQYQDSNQREWTVSQLTEIAQVTGWQTAEAVAGCCEATWEKAGLAGRGTPYQRTMVDKNNPDIRLNGKFNGSQKPPGTSQLSPAEEHKSRFVSHDRHLIDKHGSTRAHWALGLLSVEEDMQRITLSDCD